VVAESPYRVADALELVRVEYEPLPALTTVEAALASPTRLHDGWPDNAALAVGAAIGDAERALATADIVIHETFRHPRLAAVPIEPRGVLAYRDRDSGALVVWSSCQNPYSVRDIVAAALELPAEAVRVVVPDVGGGFGPKGGAYPEEILVPAAAIRLGRAVKWIEDRSEHLASSSQERGQLHEVEVATDDSGRILAVRDRFLHDAGAFQTGLGVTVLLALAWSDSLLVVLTGVSVASWLHVLSHVLDRNIGGRPATDIPGLVSVAVLATVAALARMTLTRRTADPAVGPRP